MIKANELRIGNWVFNDPYTREVWIDDFIGQEYKDNKEVFEYFNPIPITEEWLLRFGFVNNSIAIYGIDKTLNVSAVVDGNYYLYLDDVFGSFYDLNSIQYVHQLQNLYFALTGEELKQKRK